MNKTKGARIVAVVLLTVLLLTTLVSCGTSRATTVPTPTVNTDAFLDLDKTECSLDAASLKNLAEMLVATYNKVDDTYKTPEMLVAAYRGYDMLDPAFDDTAIDPAEAGEPNLAAVVKLLDAAKLKSDADSKANFDYSGINAADVEVIIRSIQTTVDLDAKGGVWDTLLGWIGVALGWITGTLGGGYYIIGICIFAILVEILMLPLSIKQQKSSIKQAKLKPKEMAIRKKYAGRDDQVTRQKVATEIQELYQRENVSAASGCMPLLIQMPIILALYNIVIDPLHYVLGQASGMSSALNLYYSTARAAGGFGHAATQAGRGTIEILSNISKNLEGLKDFMLLGNGEAVFERMNDITIPNFTLGSVNLGEIPSFGGTKILLIVPVLTFVVYFLSMRLTKKFTYQPSMAQSGVDEKQAACSNWMMDIMMPLMSVYITFIVPALIGIYWMFKSVLSTLSRFIISRIFPYPKFTEEDYRAAEREYAGKAPKSTTPGQYSYGRDTKMVGGRPKSLFHMDDDDYVAKIEAEEKKEAEQKAASEAKPAADSRLDGATLKEDDRPHKDKNKGDGK